MSQSRKTSSADARDLSPHAADEEIAGRPRDVVRDNPRRRWKNLLEELQRLVGDEPATYDANGMGSIIMNQPCCQRC